MINKHVHAVKAGILWQSLPIFLLLVVTLMGERGGSLVPSLAPGQSQTHLENLGHQRSGQSAERHFCGSLGLVSFRAGS